jgi:hypothetical protein
LVVGAAFISHENGLDNFTIEDLNGETPEGRTYSGAFSDGTGHRTEAASYAWENLVKYDLAGEDRIEQPGAASVDVSYLITSDVLDDQHGIEDADDIDMYDPYVEVTYTSSKPLNYMSFTDHVLSSGTVLDLNPLFFAEEEGVFGYEIEGNWEPVPPAKWLHMNFSQVYVSQVYTYLLNTVAGCNAPQGFVDKFLQTCQSAISNPAENPIVRANAYILKELWENAGSVLLQPVQLNLFTGEEERKNFGQLVTKDDGLDVGEPEGRPAYMSAISNAKDPASIEESGTYFGTLAHRVAVGMFDENYTPEGGPRPESTRQTALGGYRGLR